MVIDPSEAEEPGAVAVAPTGAAGHPGGTWFDNPNTCTRARPRWQKLAENDSATVDRWESALAALQRERERLHVTGPHDCLAAESGSEQHAACNART